jgi:peptidoglycan/LPS O-acetylase OafA/YrhL
MAEKIGNGGTIKSIQILRTIAALSVVYFHCTAPRGGYNFPQTGSFGVDIFFIISGFIIAYAVSKNTNGFLLKRIARIVPLYAIGTFMMALTALVFRNLIYSTQVSISGLINSLLFIPYKMETRNGPILETGWTLNFEMFFYAVMAVCIAVVKNRKLLTSVCTGLLIVFTIMLNILNSDIHVLKVYQKGLFPVFIYGMLLYQGYILHGNREPAGKGIKKLLQILIPAITASASFFYLIYSDITGFQITGNRNIYYGIPSFLIVSSMVLLEKHIKNNAVIKFLAELGEASYAMYLFHPFIILFLSRIIFPKATGNSGSVIINIAEITSAIGTVIVLSIIIYELIDKQIQKHLRRLFKNKM